MVYNKGSHDNLVYTKTTIENTSQEILREALREERVKRVFGILMVIEYLQNQIPTLPLPDI